MAIEPISTATLASLVGGIIAYILRERHKGKNSQENNGDIKDIKKTTKETKVCLNKVNTSLGIISNDVKNMRQNCTQTTERFGKEITENRKDIKDILKDK